VPNLNNNNRKIINGWLRNHLARKRFVFGIAGIRFFSQQLSINKEDLFFINSLIISFSLNITANQYLINYMLCFCCFAVEFSSKGKTLILCIFP